MDRESQAFPKGTSSDNDPIELQDVTQTEFESLLDFLYDGCVLHLTDFFECYKFVFRMHNETTPSLAAWTSLLSISTRFEMNRIRTRAIAEIISFRPNIDPVDQVVLAVQHNIPEWLPLGYAALCQREDPLELEEAERLGMKTTVLLAKARESVRKIGSVPQNNIPMTPELDIGPGWPGYNRPPSPIRVQPLTPDSAPFDASLVDRVLTEIFWPTPVVPEPEVPPPQEGGLHDSTDNVRY